MLLCCVAVLWSAVLCCCGVCVVRHAENSALLMYMSASLFCSFSREKRITFHDVCFSKPLTFHNDFMFFCFSQLFQALFETSSPTYFSSQVGLEVSKSA